MIIDNNKFNGALALSAMLHIIIVAIFFFGLPSLFKKLPEEENIISFEVVHFSQVPNIKTQAPN